MIETSGYNEVIGPIKRPGSPDGGGDRSLLSSRLAGPIRHRRDLIRLIDAATRRRVTLVCAPAGTGKTTACAAWAQAKSAECRVIWLALNTDSDQQWFWASICAGLQRAGVLPHAVMHRLEEEPTEGFPLQLAVAAWHLAAPVAVVIDNAHQLTDRAVLAGLDQLLRHAPARLRFVLSGRRPPRLQLGRLRAAGDLSDVGPDELSGAPGPSGLRAAAGSVTRGLARPAG
jgi:LuxR family maltose regulon positive regulatory protein